MKSTKRLITYEAVTMNEEQKLFQQQDLGKDREIVLDANIAKFMKSRKVADFETLFNETTKMIKTFNPQNKDIKIAIERLISKQLLQRDEKDMNKIKYID